MVDTDPAVATQQGLTVLLAGVRADLFAALERVGITERHPADWIFREEDEDYSATLKAIRTAYRLGAIDAAGTTKADGGGASNELAYYLV